MKNPKTLRRRLAAGATAAGLCAVVVPTAQPATAALRCNAATSPCTGTLYGAPYKVEVPARWNGALVIYSHGFRAPVALPGIVPTVDRTAPSARTAATATWLLSRGYAIAGSAAVDNGWAVNEGVRAADDLYAWFSRKVAVPRKVIVTGDSMGGLVTQVLAETRPWVTGSLPVCGALGGTNLSADLATDALYAIRQLFAPTLKISGWTSPQEVGATIGQAIAAVSSAPTQPGGAAKLYALQKYINAPVKSRNFDGRDVPSQIGAITEGVATASATAILFLADVERRAGESVASNARVDYAARVDTEELALFRYAFGDEVLETINATVAAGERERVDEEARAAGSELGEVTGAARVPTVVMHTAYDPLVTASSAEYYKQLVAAKGLSRNLVTVYTTPPPLRENADGTNIDPSTGLSLGSYDKVDPATGLGGAPYGVGHCTFTQTEYQSAFWLLEQWLRTPRTTPTWDKVTAAFAKAPGFEADESWSPGEWPGGPTKAAPPPEDD